MGTSRVGTTLRSSGRRWGASGREEVDVGELWRRTALELAAMIAAKEVSESGVVEAHLERFDAVKPVLNGVRMVRAGGARAGATAADRAVAGGEALGPLHGVPFTVKQNIAQVGCPTN